LGTVCNSFGFGFQTNPPDPLRTRRAAISASLWHKCPMTENKRSKVRQRGRSAPQSDVRCRSRWRQDHRVSNTLSSAWASPEKTVTQKLLRCVQPQTPWTSSCWQHDSRSQGQNHCGGRSGFRRAGLVLGNRTLPFRWFSHTDAAGFNGPEFCDSGWSTHQDTSLSVGSDCNKRRYYTGAAYLRCLPESGMSPLHKKLTVVELSV